MSYLNFLNYLNYLNNSNNSSGGLDLDYLNYVHYYNTYVFLFQYILNTKENKTCKIPMPFLHKQLQGEDRRQQLISFYILILVSIGV